MPELIEAKQISKSSNAVTIRVTISAAGVIQYAVCLQGTVTPSVDDIKYSNLKTALLFGKQSLEGDTGQ